MRLLLDANALFRSLFDRSLLTPRVRDLLDDDGNDLFVSDASLWELSAKIVRGRLPVPHRSIVPILGQLKTIGVATLPIEMADILATESLEPHHGDPFDRLIIAQAIRRDLTVLTSDDKIPLYSVPVIWK